MEIFREVEVACNADELIVLIERVENLLPDGWLRNRDAERMLHDETFYCFGSKARAGIPNAYIWLVFKRHQNALRVTNIVPNAVGRLTTASYNAVVVDFYNNALNPAATALGLTTSMSNEDVDFSHWGMSGESMALLESFSNAANKATGAAHPLDRRRWLAFLCSVYRDNATLDTTSLGRFLVETYGWSESVASDLRLEYEFAMELLNSFDGSR